MGLEKGQKLCEHSDIRLRTSIRDSKDGTRSKIECKIRSGSMTLMDFKQLWMLSTVVES